MSHRLQRRSRTIVGIVLAAGLVGAGAVATLRDGERFWERGRCAERLNREVLDRSLALGTQFLLSNQRAEGNFHYEYDWKTKTLARGDNQVRQAGAAWGLALIYHDRPRPEVGAAVQKALAFFERHSKVTEGNARYIVYPGDRTGRLGTVALLALAHIDTLRAAESRLSEEDRARYRRHLNEYLAFLLSARREDGRFRDRYAVGDGRSHGSPSPYSEGESLLALAKAARYLGRDDLVEMVLATADTGHRANVVEALERDPDSRTTKGYYQWSSMAYLELATSDWPNTDVYGTWLVELADWMIDVHRTLDRTRNTAYAYEGIVSAYRMAVLRGDRAHERKLGCTIERGLEKLTTWQVGSPIANRFIRNESVTDPLALGGVQNHAEEAPLRIDVTQHQMHAVILARRYLYRTEADAPSKQPEGSR